MILTRQQIKNMEAQGLSKQRIEEIAKERGFKMPSASIGGLLGKAARFTGVEKLGQGLGYALFQLTPEYKGLVQDLESGRISPDEFESLTTGGITTGEVLGSAVQTAGTIASFGQLGRLAKARSATTALGNVRRGATIGAGVGGTIGGTKGVIEGIKTGEGISGIVSRGVGGAIGGGLIGAGAGAIGGAMTGGAFREGARVGAIEGAKSGAVFGGTRAMGESLAEDEDISGLTARTLGGTIRGAIGGAIFGSLIGGTIGAGMKGWELRQLRKAELSSALRETTESITPTVSRRAAPYNIEQTTQGAIVKKDKLFSKAIRDTSLTPDDIAIVKSSQKGDYDAYREMIKIAKSDDIMQVEKPVAKAGQTFIKRLEDISSAKNQAAREIGDIAQTRLNKDIPQLQQSINQFNDDLASYGVSVQEGKLNFKGSDFEDLPGVQRFIETIYRRAGELNNNGLKAHQLKRFIDEQVAYGRQVEGLTGTAERLVKSFRRGVDFILDNADSGYNLANNRYRTAIGAQTDVQRIMGRDFNITDEFATMKAGEVMNRILGNAAARPLQVLNDVEKSARELGYKYSDNVVAQIKFADMLEDIIGAPTRSLGGQIERVINRATGLKDFIRKSLPFADNAGEFLKTSLSRTPEQRLNSLLDYINKLSK